MLRRLLRPTSLRIAGVRYASRLRPSSRSQKPEVHRQPSRLPQRPQDAPSQAQGQSSTTPSIADALKNADPASNSLLAPVHIPEDPNAVLKERHPATALLANSGLVVQRQIEMLNVFLGFEQANRYVILDAQGNHVGYMAETDGGIGKSLARQTFRTHRAFTTHIFDRSEREVLRFHRPFSWVNSKIRVYDPIEAPSFPSNDLSTSVATTAPGSLVSREPSNPHISPLQLSQMKIIGEAQQVWAPLRRKYNLFLFHEPPSEHPPIAQLPVNEKDLSSSQALQVLSQSGVGQYSQFAAVDEPFLSWDFSLLSKEKQLIGSVNRNFAGFAREIFTDTGVYALRMDSAGLSEESQNRHLISQTGQSPIAPKVPSMTLDQRAVMLATAVSVDFDYFSRHGGGSGFLPIPMWMGGGEAAGAGAAGAEAAGAAGGAEAAGGVITGEAGAAGAGAIGRAAGANGAGEGAMAGAGTMAGYEILQRGRDGQPMDPPPQDGSQYPYQPPQEGQVGQGEDVWGQGDDPFNQQGSGGQGGEGGDGGGWSIWDFFDGDA